MLDASIGILEFRNMFPLGIPLIGRWDLNVVLLLSMKVVKAAKCPGVNLVYALS